MNNEIERGVVNSRRNEYLGQCINKMSNNSVIA